jgi:hypothetical protein
MAKKKDPVAAYIEQAAPAHRETLAALDALIRKDAPMLEPAVHGKLIGYGKYHYKYASGREGDTFVIGLASNKGSMSMYVCIVDKGSGKYLAESRAAELGKVNVGKSCIRFKKLEDLELPALRRLVKDAVKLRKTGLLGV